MKIALRIVAFLGLLALPSPGFAERELPGANLKLWYLQPAQQWRDALPVGNGRLGAMIYGEAIHERLQLNEEGVWAGGPWEASPAGAAEALGEVRRLLLARKPVEAEAIAASKLLPKPLRLPPYQTLGTLCLDFSGKEQPSGYRRELDLENGIAAVCYEVRGVHYRREVFVSHPDGVLVVRLTADKPGALDFLAKMTRVSLASQAEKMPGAAGEAQLLLSGQCDVRQGLFTPEEIRAVGGQYKGAHFVAVAGMRAEGGEIHTSEESCWVEKADAVTLLLAAATDNGGADPLRRCRETLEASWAKGFPRLRAAHVADYRALFDRVRLDVGRSPAAEALPTDARLQRLQQGEADPGLAALFFHYGRYLLISSSRPGCKSAGYLQGLWSDGFHPPGENKPTLDVHAEMNYWPAEVCNLPECHEPLFDLADALREPGRATARTLYGCGGFVVHHATDYWRHTGPAEGVAPGLWTLGGGWLALHLWEHCQFGADRAFLAQRAYPVLKEASEFFTEALVEDPQTHRLVTAPSEFPGSRYVDPATHSSVALGVGSSFDSQLLAALFGATLEAGRQLGLDADFLARVEAARDRLPPLRTGRYGQILDWLDEVDQVGLAHPHLGPLVALYPGTAITPRGTPPWAEAARQTLERQEGTGRWEGWAGAWRMLCRARLLDGEKASSLLDGELGYGCSASLLNGNNGFQIDGNLGFTAGIAELLLQSQGGELNLLPALPKAWPEGSVRGLRARGGFEVSLTWSQGALRTASLRATSSGPCRLRTARPVKIMLEGRPVKTRPVEGEGAVEFSAEAGKTYTLEG